MHAARSRLGALTRLAGMTGFGEGEIGAGMTGWSEDGMEGATQSAEEAADRVGAAFETAARSISDSMERAGRSGALSMERMVESMLGSLARLAIEQAVTRPLEGLLSSAFSGAGAVIGARAEGGPVLGGERYLVGERGPEIFTPGRSGGITPAGGAPVVNVTINAGGGDAGAAARRSHNQIAAAVARAVRQGSGQL